MYRAQGVPESHASGIAYSYINMLSELWLGAFCIMGQGGRDGGTALAYCRDNGASDEIEERLRPCFHSAIASLCDDLGCIRLSIMAGMTKYSPYLPVWGSGSALLCALLLLIFYHAGLSAAEPRGTSEHTVAAGFPCADAD